MRAMLFAAGLGTRLRPLTLHTPKPLLPVAGKALIVHHIERLVAAGIRELVVNVSWLGEQIESALGDGARWGARIRYSPEPGAPLETGGGIRRALPLLGDGPFLVISADVWCDYPLGALATEGLPAGAEARLVVVPNPPQHPEGDFRLQDDGRLLRGVTTGQPCTYSGIGLLSPALLRGWDEEVFPLREPLRAAAARHSLYGCRWAGDWEDVGTVERYEALSRRVDATGS
ncbi:MAG: N-acetylmuramate alpha-1-phosphate uridylyltransferase MurU [Gammaproteobacteria bacterium]